MKEGRCQIASAFCHTMALTNPSRSAIIMTQTEGSSSIGRAAVSKVKCAFVACLFLLYQCSITEADVVKARA